MKVISVIVAYQPEIKELSRMVEQLLSSGVVPVVVNNSDYLMPITLGCDVIELRGNKGIATAQNEGIRFAKERGADIIIFFDQDSIISEPLVQALVSPIICGETKMTAPIFYDQKKGFFYKIVRISKFGRIERFGHDQLLNKFETNSVISSGHTVLSSVFDIVGLFEDNFFIDYVDTEWCLRASSFGFKTLICSQAVMQHSIGDNVIDLKLLRVPVHSPYRRYYRIRNSFMLLKKAHIPKLLAIREVLFSVLHQLILITFCQKKKEYFKYLKLAIADGLNGKKGKLDI